MPGQPCCVLQSVSVSTMDSAVTSMELAHRGDS